MDKLFSKMHWFELTIVASLMVAFLAILFVVSIEALFYVKVKNEVLGFMMVLNAVNTFIFAAYVLYRAMKRI